MTWENGLPDWATFQDMREITTALSPTKTQTELVQELIAEIEAQGEQAGATHVFTNGLRMRRHGQAGIQAYTQVVFGTYR